ncbi:MAG: hypothetical protein Fur0034_16280 [Desulfuromonadia bacterium]
MRRLLPYVLMLLVVNPFAPVPAVSFELAMDLGGAIDRLGKDVGEIARFPLDGGVGSLTVAGSAAATWLLFRHDESLRREMGRLSSPGVHRAARIGSMVGDPFLHIGVAAGGYAALTLAPSPLWQGRMEELGRALILADGVTLLLKEGVGRERPFVSGKKDRFTPFGFEPDNDSFPSMHTASSFAAASVVSSWSDSRVFQVLARVPALFVLFSRLERDRHWGSDTLPAVLIGEVAGYVATHHERSRGGVAIVPAITAERVTLNLVIPW